MAFVVNMPRLGLTEEENVLGEWFVQEGDRVEKGDRLFSIETDKSSMEVYADHAGTVLKCLYEDLDVVPVMTAVCVIGEAGEDISGLAAAPQAAQEEKPAPAPQAEEPKAEPKHAAAPLQSAITNAASPRAKKLAEANGVELAGIIPSGAEGRIIEEDVLRSMSTAAPNPSPAPSATPGGRTVPVSNIRRLIGENIMNSLRNTAQTTQHMRYNASRLQSYRAWLKNAPGPEKDISLHELISYITVKTLARFDYMNAHMRTPDELTLFDAVNLGCAVGTPKGLLVPTVKNAQDMSLAAFSAAMKGLVQKAKDGTLLPNEMADATFTISNLGSYGITTFTPVLNPPQVGILGVGTIDYAVKNTPEGILYYPAGYLSLTYDHRAMDGVPAIEFFRALCDNLESADMLTLGE